MKKLTFILSLAVILASCQKKPSACISAEKSGGNVNDIIKFTNCSSNDHSSLWLTNDDVSIEVISSNDKEVSYKFKGAGTFQITLRVSSKNGMREDETTEEVTIK